MPAALTYPGVYVEEIPSSVHTIVGVATSITAFIGRAERGPVNVATTINSFGDFQKQFGGLWEESSLGFAVKESMSGGLADDPAARRRSQESLDQLSTGRDEMQ